MNTCSFLPYIFVPGEYPSSRKTSPPTRQHVWAVEKMLKVEFAVTAPTFASELKVVSLVRGFDARAGCDLASSLHFLPMHGEARSFGLRGS